MLVNCHRHDRLAGAIQRADRQHLDVGADLEVDARIGKPAVSSASDQAELLAGGA